MDILDFKPSTFAYVNARKKTPPEIHCIYLENKDIYCILKILCIIYVLFCTKCCLFQNCVLFYPNSTFFIHHAGKFKYQSGCVKIKILNNSAVKFMVLSQSPVEFFVFVLGLCPSAGTVSCLPCQNHSECVVHKSLVFFAFHICFCVPCPSCGTADHIFSY